MPELMINGLPLPIQATGEHSQQYADVQGGGYRTRMRSGALRVQRRWRKLAVTFSGTGVVPLALEGISPDQPVVVRCSASRGVTGAGRVLTMPAARRTDVDLIGQAQVGDEVVRTDVESVVGNVATLAAVAGASAYRCLYWPEITAYLTVETDVRFDTGEHGWQVMAEEA